MLAAFNYQLEVKQLCLISSQMAFFKICFHQIKLCSCCWGRSAALCQDWLWCDVPAGERRPGLRQHFRPVQHEHAEGPGVSAVRRPGEPVGAVSLHRLQPVRQRAGVQRSQSNPCR